MDQRDSTPGGATPPPGQHTPPQQAKKKSSKALGCGCLGLVAVGVVIAIAVAAGGNSTSAASSQTPLQQAVSQLRGEDGNAHAPSDYQAALAALTKQCTQTDPGQLANMTDAVEQGLTKAGISEDRLSLLQHFSQSIPAGSKPMNCVDIFAAYETLREGQ